MPIAMFARRALAATLPAALAASFAGCRSAPADPAPGVSLELAGDRARTVGDLSYRLALEVPDAPNRPVTGTVTIGFDRKDDKGPIVLDFKAPAEYVRSVSANGEPLEYRTVPDHLIVTPPADTGRASVTVAFQATDLALNRQPDFLYTLFVPDRASTAFPCFDQPDLKARYTLELRIPARWQAVANGALVSRDSSGGDTHLLRFEPTRPLSTYLVAFAAGTFSVEEAVRDGRTLHLYHRETDRAKVARNRDAIFDLEAGALRWLESYTGIAFPFDKFDFFAVPSFQFGGMEHPGAVWYRANGLFLDPSATQNELLGRASLIAHETAHMWFGDLVTMRWFNDVWMKEVFANFMAAKIVEPAFPEVDHRLRFYLAHHASAYAVDRTAGANPIRQPLENLNDAASLYGAIIYQKAPIVMRQLEQLIGPEVMQTGLRRYLDRFRYGNATWTDLIGILDQLSPADLARWSHAWVEEPGRPTIPVARDPAAAAVRVSQRDDWPGRDLRWEERLTLGYPSRDTLVRVSVDLGDSAVRVPLPGAATPPAFVLPGIDGLSYGRFVLDSASRTALLRDLPALADPLARAVGWNTLSESARYGSTPPAALVDLALRSLAVERNPLLIDRFLGGLGDVYWTDLARGQRDSAAPAVEALLWRGLAREPTPGRKLSYFNALVALAVTPASVDRLTRIWAGQDPLPGLPLAERQYTALAEALALRSVPDADSILDAQEARIDNPDRLARFRFVRPSLSADSARRDSVFQSLADPANRRHEPWVLSALGYLNHPLRGPGSERYIEPALNLMEQVKATGDIFFPLAWASASLSSHRSAETTALLERWLAARPDYPPRLRGKILQAGEVGVRE